MKKILTIAVLGLIAILILIQFLPFGRDHTNPPVVQEPNWDSPQTRQLAVVACYDCHSNESTWPWYSNVAPVSWMVDNHIQEGREILNFSEWNRAQGEGAEEAAEVIQEGEMPPTYYTLAHPPARFSAEQKQQLIDGLIASGIALPEGQEGEEDDHD